MKFAGTQPAVDVDRPDTPVRHSKDFDRERDLNEKMNAIVTLINLTGGKPHLPLKYLGVDSELTTGIVSVGESTIEVFFEGDGTIFRARAFTDTVHIFSEDEEMRSKAIEGHLFAGLSCCFAVSVATKDFSRTANAVSSWIKANEIGIVLGGAGARMFGPKLYAVFTQQTNPATGAALRLIVFDLNPTKEQINVAGKYSLEDRTKAEEKASAETSWKGLQETLRGIEGYDMQPSIDENAADAIAVGDAMLSVAKRLSIFGKETLVVEGLSRVEWIDGDRKLLVDFEDGRVVGKTLL